MKKYYAGIGSRSTPAGIEAVIKHVCVELNELGYVLRSGGAEGADTMFERYAARAQIFLPWPSFGVRQQPDNLHHFVQCEPSLEAYDVARYYHPAWDRCSDGAKKLHARNSHQVLGISLRSPVEVVVCWTRDETEGGTSQALRIARDYKIPIINLFDEKTRTMVMAPSILETVRR